MTWQEKVEHNSPDSQLQSATPSRAHVPMEELEVRASRYVSLLEGDMENAKPLPSSNRVPPLLVEGWVSRVLEEEAHRAWVVGPT